jgi:LacI family transcriptional regulator
VQNAAARLGYSKPAVPALRDIGLIFYDRNHINTELHMQIQSGVQREADRLNRPVRSQWADAGEAVVDLARSCAGLLLVGAYDHTTITTLRSIGVPTVRLGWIDPLEQADQVVTTDREGGQAAITYLIGLAHRCIAFVAGAPGFRGRHERYNGARDMAERDARVSLHRMHFNEEGGFTASLHALHKRGVHPTAFFCANDGLALTVVSELLGLGYRIPEQLSVVGYGDFSAATQISPQLTTIHVEGAEMGAVALRLLLERIESGAGTEAPARRIQIASRIIERRSAGPLSNLTVGINIVRRSAAKRA